MSIWKFLGGPIQDLIREVRGLVDDVTTTDEERLELRRKLEELEQQTTFRVMELAAAEMAAQRDVIVAEMQQDDRYTKRARPTVVYAGLGALALNHIILPWITFLSGSTPPAIDLPAEFWLGWSGIVATWAIGRSVEKVKRQQGDELPPVVRRLVG